MSKRKQTTTPPPDAEPIKRDDRTYIILSPLNYEGKRLEVGRIVALDSLDTAEIASLIALKIIKEA